MAEALFRPLSARDDGLQARWSDGRAMSSVAAEFVKPNDRLTAVERLEIYARSYWFRVLDCLYEDFPGLIAVVGEKKFMKIATDFLAQFPSESFTMRNLGSRLPAYIEGLPGLPAIAPDMARFEWAQVLAFDGPSLPALTQDDVLDAGPEKLKVSLQPYLTLLECKYPVDDFALALKKNRPARRGQQRADGDAEGAKGPQILGPAAAATFAHLHSRAPARQHALFQTPGAGGVRDPRCPALRPHGGGRLRGGAARRGPVGELGGAHPGVVSVLAGAGMVLSSEAKACPRLILSRSSTPITRRFTGLRSAWRAARRRRRT